MPVKTIGVLGGMGPEATVLFFQKLVEFTPAKYDQDHIPIIIYNNPQVPDRTQAILEGGENPVPALQKGAAILKNAGADFICIPCNTVHYYFEEIQQSSDLPVMNLIDAVVEFAINSISNLRKVGLLATKGTIKSGLYQKAFHNQNVEVIVPEDAELPDLQNIIQALKNKSKESHAAQLLAQRLIKNGAQALVLGCTELSLIASTLGVNIPILDSTAVLAQKAVRNALVQDTF
ncbi:MAG: aspartate/glutamate racemase family protein [bacterium]